MGQVSLLRMGYCGQEKVNHLDIDGIFVLRYHRVPRVPPVVWWLIFFLSTNRMGSFGSLLET